MSKVCKKCGIEKELTEFHKDKSGKFGRKYLCRVCSSKKDREWRTKNIEKARARNRASYAKNKHKKFKRERERLQEDPIARMIKNYRNRTRDTYKDKKSSLDLLGCSGAELAQHLEKQFQEGMTHDNYGEWHIDHIRPIASFDLSNPKEAEECFHYTNLQPLWAIDNLTKGSKL